MTARTPPSSAGSSSASRRQGAAPLHSRPRRPGAASDARPSFSAPLARRAGTLVGNNLGATADARKTPKKMPLGHAAWQCCRRVAASQHQPWPGRPCQPAVALPRPLPSARPSFWSTWGRKPDRPTIAQPSCQRRAFSCACSLRGPPLAIPPLPVPHVGRGCVRGASALGGIPTRPRQPDEPAARAPSQCTVNN